MILEFPNVDFLSEQFIVFFFLRRKIFDVIFPTVCFAVSSMPPPYLPRYSLRSVAKSDQNGEVERSQSAESLRAGTTPPIASTSISSVGGMPLKSCRKMSSEPLISRSLRKQYSFFSRFFTSSSSLLSLSKKGLFWPR